MIVQENRERICHAKLNGERMLQCHEQIVLYILQKALQ